MPGGDNPVNPGNISPTVWGAVVGGLFVILGKVLDAPLSRLVARGQRRQDASAAQINERVTIRQSADTALEWAATFARDQVEQLRQEFAAYRDQAEKDKRAADDRVADLAADLAQVKQQERHTKAENVALKARVETLETENAALRQEVATMKAQLGGVILTPPQSAQP